METSLPEESETLIFQKSDVGERSTSRDRLFHYSWRPFTYECNAVRFKSSSALSHLVLFW